MAERDRLDRLLADRGPKKSGFFRNRFLKPTLNVVPSPLESPTKSCLKVSFYRCVTKVLWKGYVGWYLRSQKYRDLSIL